MGRKSREQAREERKVDGTAGRVVEILGRRVRVTHEGGDAVCFLSGFRVVVGDEVRWVEAKGEGGKIVGVEPRRTALIRREITGLDQVLAANLEGVLIVVAAREPPFRAGLVDRYVVAAHASGLEVAVVVNKSDQGLEDESIAEIALREAFGIPFLYCSSTVGDGVDTVSAFVAAHDGGPWALVGHSGVGKTTLVKALLPEIDVGPIGDLSEYWGTGQHTTTRSRLFGLPGGGELVDSPGIRMFAPGGIGPQEVRSHFPGMAGMPCKYRDCLHREGEEGCVAEETVGPALVQSYRRLLADVIELFGKRQP